MLYVLVLTAPSPLSRQGVLREFKRGDLQFNYGCLPRTWEDPNTPHQDTGFNGDDDPIDVCEIGLKPITTGSIRPVKVLGVLAMVSASHGAAGADGQA